MRLAQIIKKNFLVLIRSKSSALIILLGPLLVMFLVGMAFNKASSYNIKIGYYSEDYSDLSNSFVKALSEKYSTVKYSNLESCISDVKLGAVHTCIEFPPGLKIDKDADQVKEIVFYVDSSRLNLVESVINTITDMIRKQSGQISSQLTEVLIDALKETQSEIASKKALFGELKKENQDLRNNVVQIQAKLDSLDTKMSSSSFKVGILTEQISSLKATGIKSIDTSRAGLFQIKSKVSGTNATYEQKQETYNLIDSTITKLNVVSEELDNLTNASDISSLNWLIYNLEENIKSIQQKLDKVGDARSNVTVEVGEINSLLNSSYNKVVVLETSFNSISSGIDAIKIKDVEKIVRPINVRVSPVLEQTKLNYIIPTLLIIVVMFVSILLATTLVVMEKNSSAKFRNNIAPTGDLTFFLATYFTAVILIAVQVAIMLGINAYMFKAFLTQAQILNLGAILIMIITVFVLIGMFIGYLFQSEETATLGAVSVGSIFMLVSSTIIPLESIPASVLKIANYNPFVIADSLVKKVYLFGTDLIVVAPDLKLLFMYSIALLVLALIVQKLSKFGLFDRPFAKIFLFFHRAHQKKEQKQKEKIKAQVKAELENESKSKSEKDKVKPKVHKKE